MTLPVLTPETMPAGNSYVTTPLCFPEAFSAEECDAALALEGGDMRYRSATIRPVEGYRSAMTMWIDPGPATQLIMDRFSAIIEQVNSFYSFEISGFREPFLLCRYRAGDGFEWHCDAAQSMTATRKLSLSIQLSDPADYEGGGLEFMPQGEIPFSRSRGSVVVFPSYLCHRVARVTRGERSSIVCWAHGPTFR